LQFILGQRAEHLCGAGRVRTEVERAGGVPAVATEEPHDVIGGRAGFECLVLTQPPLAEQPRQEGDRRRPWCDLPVS